MKLTHEFTVPVDIDSAWSLLLDLPRMARCMPGATVDAFDGGNFTGSVKVKLGPMQIVYRGAGRFDNLSTDDKTAVVTAQGKESRSSGTANATITLTLTEAGAGAAARVDTDLAITGRPAQLGRGLIDDVAGRLIATFAEELANEIGDEPGSDQQPASPDSPSISSRNDLDALEVGSLGGAALLRRGWPALAGLSAILVGHVWWTLKRRRGIGGR